MFFALLTNILVGSQLLLGGSAVVTALTGMNVYAAIFLIRKLSTDDKALPVQTLTQDYSGRSMRLRGHGGSASDFLVRLLSHPHPYGHHSLLHVQHLRRQSLNRQSVEDV